MYYEIKKVLYIFTFLAILTLLANVLLPSWIKVDPEYAWKRIARAAARDNERYIINDYTTPSGTLLSRIWIERDAWEMLKSCPSEELLCSPVTIISDAGEDRSEIQIDCPAVTLRCYVSTKSVSGYDFFVYTCEPVPETVHQ